MKLKIIFVFISFLLTKNTAKHNYNVEQSTLEHTLQCSCTKAQYATVHLNISLCKILYCHLEHCKLVCTIPNQCYKIQPTYKLILEKASTHCSKLEHCTIHYIHLTVHTMQNSTIKYCAKQ